MKNKESYKNAERVRLKKKYHSPAEQGPRPRRSSKVVGNTDARSETDNFDLVLCVSWSSIHNHAFEHSKGKMWDSHGVTIHICDSIKVDIQVQCFYCMLTLVTSPE